MPIYEFECKKCGEIFEEYQSLHDTPLTKCKICKKGKVIKLISLPGRPVVPGDWRDDAARIKREAKETAKKILKGDEKAIADVYGDDVANGKPRKQSSVKTFKDVKGKGVIKKKQ